jgi:hypothetical protein
MNVHAASATITIGASDVDLRADPMKVFRALAWARAYLWSVSEIPDLPAAVDPLQANALAIGLDTDIAQRIMADAFHGFREFPQEAAKLPEVPTARPILTSSTICATRYVLRQQDPGRLQAWLDKHSPEQREAMLPHVKEFQR